jgi:hypothetical protein
MNLETMKEMREVFAATPEHKVDMSTFGVKTDCGTKHCLGGTYLAYLTDKGAFTGCRWLDSYLPGQYTFCYDKTYLRIRLGLSYEEYNYLFIDSADMTKDEALERLDEFIAVGGIPEKV